MIRIGTLEEAYYVFLNIPEFDKYLSFQEMRERLADECLIVVAEVEKILVGFKIGYPKNNTEYYSWLGGVVPSHRRSGVAQKLLDFQED